MSLLFITGFAIAAFIFCSMKVLKHTKYENYWVAAMVFFTMFAFFAITYSAQKAGF